MRGVNGELGRHGYTLLEFSARRDPHQLEPALRADVHEVARDPRPAAAHQQAEEARRQLLERGRDAGARRERRPVSLRADKVQLYDPTPTEPSAAK